MATSKPSPTSPPPYRADLFDKFARHHDAPCEADDWGEVLSHAQMVEETRGTSESRAAD